MFKLNVGGSDGNKATQGDNSAQQGEQQKPSFTLGATSSAAKQPDSSADNAGAASPAPAKQANAGLLLPNAKPKQPEKPVGLGAALAGLNKTTPSATPKTSGLAAALEKKEAASTEKRSGIAPLALQEEKYVLTAEASEKLPQDVLEAFASKMQYLITAMDTADLPNAMYAVLTYTQEHPHLKDILRANDVGLMVKACRTSYGMTVVAKSSNKKKATKKSALDADVLASLADLEINI